MSTVAHSDIRMHNNVARMHDTEHAKYLLRCIEPLVTALLGSDLHSGHLERMHQRYTDGVPQELCNRIGRLADIITDRLRRFDPQELADIAQYEQDMRDQCAFHFNYAADSIQGEYC